MALVLYVNTPNLPLMAHESRTLSTSSQRWLVCVICVESVTHAQSVCASEIMGNNASTMLVKEGYMIKSEMSAYLVNSEKVAHQLPEVNSPVSVERDKEKKMCGERPDTRVRGEMKGYLGRIVRRRKEFRTNATVTTKSTDTKPSAGNIANTESALAPNASLQRHRKPAERPHHHHHDHRWPNSLLGLEEKC